MRQSLKLFTLIAFWAILIPLTGISQFSITGKVSDSQTGEGLPGAHIQIEYTDYSTYSKPDGTYVLRNIPGASYFVKVSFIGYSERIENVNLTGDLKLDFPLSYTAIMSDEVIVEATRAYDKSPTVFSTVSKELIRDNNTGQDLPYILQLTPSVVTSSDAGAGVGYTGLRIRGSDLTRINVTMNGVPVNDAESHSVYFVDLPDLASSIDNIQIQRGVGTSTNGAASFGGSINIQTSSLNPDPYGEISSVAGSFNTFKNSARFGSGLISNKWAFDGRLSSVTSDGYIDRGWSELNSYYLSGGYYGDKTIVKAITTSGKEKTYQAWNGVPKVRLENDLEGMQRYGDHWLYTPEETEHMIQSDSRTFNLATYENETDNYKQDYYQLHIAHQLNNDISLSSAMFYTKGKGYYETFKYWESYSDYGFEDAIIGGDTVTDTDLIRQKWLDNDFYGFTAALNLNKNKVKATFGGGWNQYSGDHYGYIIWAEHSSNSFINTPWYENTGKKTDFNVYGKINYQAGSSLNIYADLQFRGIEYSINGIHDDLRDLTQTHTFSFFNPKAGVYYELDNNSSLFASVAVANREPNRGVYRDADPGQEISHENLIDYEAGYRYSNKSVRLDANLYYMDYANQLVLTGQINNVGDAILVNVPESYRAGVEISGGIRFSEKFSWEFNGTLSRNKINNFVAYADDWDNWGEQISEDLGTTDISFSPEIVGGSSVTWKSFNNFKTVLTSHYVGRQYIDNTSSVERSLDPYFVNNLKFYYTIKTSSIKEIGFMLSLNNIAGVEYETNAWVYRYYYDNVEYVMDGYFPQAKFHLMGGVTLKF